MKTANSSTILFRNTMRITDGHLDGFRHAIAQAVAFAQEHGPQLMVEVFIDEERMLATPMPSAPTGGCRIRTSAR